MHIRCRAMMLLFIGIIHIPCLISQQITEIKGKVIDENGKNFPHVHIFLINSQTGTITNKDGAFLLNFKGEEDILSVSFIGYKTESVSINKLSGFIKIQMNPSPIQLDEIVISNLSASDLFKKTIEKIPDNYPIEPVLLQTYYRGKVSEKDTLLYMDESAFNIVKSYKTAFKDEYFLIKNRNFHFTDKFRLNVRRIGNVDVIKTASEKFDDAFFRKHDIEYLPGTTFDNRYVYVLTFSPKDKRKGDNGRIYIDADDLAFIRFDVNFQNGDKKYSQYKKVEGKYYLMEGYSMHLNRYLGQEVKPAESNIVTTHISTIFKKEEIEGTPIGIEDFVGSYATQNEDTIFWKKHNVLLPDSSIQQVMKEYTVRQQNTGLSDSLQYATYIKRLYAPSVSLMLSSGFAKDFQTVNYNQYSMNRFMFHLIQKNIQGVFKEQIVLLSYYVLVAFPLEEIFSEWKLLEMNGISARPYPLLYNKHGMAYLYNIGRSALSDFKNGHYTDFMRLHTIRNDGHYVKSMMIEEDLAKIDLSNKNNQYEYFKQYLPMLFYYRSSNIYNPFLRDKKVHTDISEAKQPLIIDRNRSWVKYLFNPTVEYQRHVKRADLTEQESKYLKHSSYWSWLNLVSPQMYGISKFRMGNRNSITFSLNYLRTPFGEQFGQNIWIMRNYSQLHGVFFKQYKNFEKTSFGIGYKLYDLQLFRNAFVTTSLDVWQQPSDFQFMTNSSFCGFHIGQLFEYQFLPDKYIHRNNMSLFIGYDYKTKGYLPESFYLKENFNIKAGVKVNLK